ncbi:hypothetical protein L596_014068 [Steinernema carpocapsae]|uniref:Uncharacterized protein n=1 Tax=Steinernema carpocapsae TaxID=34508 RepID=A0A4U5NAR9_STECR|nr:hypothetical protein L596_014068 [Steinernema carpocapsae]
MATAAAAGKDTATVAMDMVMGTEDMATGYGYGAYGYGGWGHGEWGFRARKGYGWGRRRWDGTGDEIRHSISHISQNSSLNFEDCTWSFTRRDNKNLREICSLKSCIKSLCFRQQTLKPLCLPVSLC